MRTKFVIFGHEINIRPAYEVRMHVTDFHTEELPEIPKWEHSFPMEKRIHAMVRHHGFISYIFRDFDVALITYRESALILLEDAMKSLKKIRSNLALRGATDEDLNKFDNRVHMCFQKTLDVIETRIEDPTNKNKEADIELLSTLETFKIYEYHKE